MTLNKEKVESFSRRFHQKYDEESILDDIVDVVSYSKEYEDLDYYKIGRRVGLPTSVINDSSDPVTVISSFVRNLWIGERNYVLRQLNDRAEEGDMSTVPIEQITRDSIRSWSGKVDNPNHIFLPADDEYFSESDLWTIAPGLGLNPHWIPLKHDINFGFLLNSSKVHLVQKWFNDMEPPTFKYNERFNEFSKNRSVGLFYGTEPFTDESQDPKYQTQVDFLYMTMLSEVLLSDRAAIRLKPQKELSAD